MADDAGQLIVYLEGQVIQTHALGEAVLTMGRLPDNGLPLPDPIVSRYHAELRPAPEGPVLTDLGSSNGTYVAGNRLLANQPHLLHGGDVFQIGPFVVAYQAPAPAAPPPATEPETTPEAEPAAEPSVEAADQVGASVAKVAVEAAAPVAEPLPDVEPARPDGFPPPAITPPPLPPAPAQPPRPKGPAPLAKGPVSSYLQHLPIIYHENDFLGRYLLIYEAIWENLERRQDHLAMYFDPRTCPATFLPWLASWLDIAVDLHWPESRTRRLVAEAMDLYLWRGTRYGLTRMIEVCTDLTPYISEDPGEPFLFRVTLSLPPDADVDQPFIEMLIQAHKPAHAGYVLDITPWRS